MNSRVHGKTPILVSNDKYYVEIRTIEELFNSGDTPYVWTPDGWELIKSIKETIDHLDNLLYINDQKNVLICTKFSNILADTFKTIDHYRDHLKFFIPDIQNLIYYYQIPIVPLPLFKKLEIKSVNEAKEEQFTVSHHFYRCEFPESKIVEIPSPISNKECDLDDYKFCNNCEKDIIANCYIYTCSTCSSKRNRYDLCPSCFENIKEYKQAYISGRIVAHESSHTIIKSKHFSRMDYYNGNNTEYLKLYLFMQISHNVCRDQVFLIPFNNNFNHNDNPLYYMQCIMEYEKLGHKDYRIEMEYNSLCLLKNFYLDVLIKHRNLFCHDICFKVLNRKERNEKYYINRNNFLKNFKKNVKKEYIKYKKEKESVSEPKYQTIFEARSVAKTFGLNTDEVKTYTIITKSGYWHAGIGKFILYNS